MISCRRFGWLAVAGAVAVASCGGGNEYDQYGLNRWDAGVDGEQAARSGRAGSGANAGAGDDDGTATSSAGSSAGAGAGPGSMAPPADMCGGTCNGLCLFGLCVGGMMSGQTPPACAGCTGICLFQTCFGGMTPPDEPPDAGADDPECERDDQCESEVCARQVCQEPDCGDEVCNGEEGTDDCPEDCGSECGDGVVNGDETCDDGETANDDGCSDACALEPGFSCDDAAPTSCEQIDACASAPCDQGRCMDLAPPAPDGAEGRECVLDPIDGGWTEFGPCTGSCGTTGTQTRTCTNPAPANGGATCAGSDTQSCQMAPCPIDGGWSAFGACMGACGTTGTQTRTCTNPAPANGGATCAGSNTQSCQVAPCPINGGWSAFGPCMGACGTTGTQTRTCTNPAPANGGTPCAGSNAQSCQMAPCPIDGGWSEWGDCVGPCGELGGQGRTCNNPAPAYGGADCEGPSGQSCMVPPC